MKLQGYKQKIALAFAVFVALLAISGLSSYWNLFGIHKSTGTVHESAYQTVQTASYLQIELLKLSNTSSLAFRSTDSFALLRNKSRFEEGAANFSKIYSGLENLPIENAFIDSKAAQVLKSYQQYLKNSRLMIDAKMSGLSLQAEVDGEVKQVMKLVDEFGATLIDIIYFAEKNDLPDVELIVGNAEQADRISLSLMRIAQEVQMTSNPERLENALRDFNFVIKDAMSWFERSAQLLRASQKNDLIEKTYTAADVLKRRLNASRNLIAIKRKELERNSSAAQAQDAAMRAVMGSIATLDTLIDSADNKFGQLQLELAGNFEFGYKKIVITFLILVALGAVYFKWMYGAINKKIGDLAKLNKLGRSLAKSTDKHDAAKKLIQNICQKTGFAQGLAFLDAEEKGWLPYGYYAEDKTITSGKVKKDRILYDSLTEAKEAKEAVFIADVQLNKRRIPGAETFALFMLPLLDKGELIGSLVLIGDPGRVLIEDSDYEFFASAAGSLVATLKNIRMREIIESHNRSLETIVQQRTAALRQKGEDMASLLSNLHQGLFTISKTGLIQAEYAPFLEKIFETDHIRSRHFRELLFSRSDIDADQIEKYTKVVESIFGQGKAYFEQCVELLPDSLVIHLDQDRSKDIVLDWNPIVNQFDSVTKLLISVRDITERRKAEEQKDILAAIFKNSLEPIALFDDDLNIKAVNNAFTDKLGAREKQVIGENLGSLFNSTHDQSFFNQISDQLKLKNTWNGEIHFDPRDRNDQVLWLTISPVGESGRATGANFLGSFSDIRQRQKVEDELRYLANYDALTSLPNRRLFSDRLEHAIALSKRQNNKLALLFIDLNRFKFINDSFGHAVGDALLKEVAHRLKACLRESDVLCRLGGDEFTILLENTVSKQDVITVANKILKQFIGPFVVNGNELRTGASVGISEYPESGVSAKDLMINADVAMYSAKRKNQGFLFFEPHMNKRAEERLKLENDLHRAVENNELFLVYQPKIDLHSGATVGAEVLLRWQHPSLGLIAPDQFIPLAEETGLIIPFGKWVLETACEKLVHWQRLGLPSISLAVNVSAKQFQTINFSATVKHAIEKNRLDPALLELELTESLLMDTESSAIKTLNVLKNMGVSLSIDDFGTGYSSLQYLSNFPIDYLKIDRSFVMGLESVGKSVAIIRAIIAMAKGLGLKVIAEGVEDMGQARCLREFGCHLAQGYYFSRPVGELEFVEILRGSTSEAKDNNNNRYRDAIAPKQVIQS